MPVNSVNIIRALINIESSEAARELLGCFEKVGDEDQPSLHDLLCDPKNIKLLNLEKTEADGSALTEEEEENILSVALFVDLAQKIAALSGDPKNDEVVKAFFDLNWHNSYESETAALITFLEKHASDLALIEGSFDDLRKNIEEATKEFRGMLYMPLIFQRQFLRNYISQSSDLEWLTQLAQKADTTDAFKNALTSHFQRFYNGGDCSDGLKHLLFVTSELLPEFRQRAFQRALIISVEKIEDLQPLKDFLLAGVDDTGPQERLLGLLKSKNPDMGVRSDDVADDGTLDDSLYQEFTKELKQKVFDTYFKKHELDTNDAAVRQALDRLVVKIAEDRSSNDFNFDKLFSELTCSDGGVLFGFGPDCPKENFKAFIEGLSAKQKKMIYDSWIAAHSACVEQRNQSTEADQQHSEESVTADLSLDAAVMGKHSFKDVVTKVDASTVTVTEVTGEDASQSVDVTDKASGKKATFTYVNEGGLQSLNAKSASIEALVKGYAAFYQAALKAEGILDDQGNLQPSSETSTTFYIDPNSVVLTRGAQPVSSEEREQFNAAFTQEFKRVLGALYQRPEGGKNSDLFAKLGEAPAGVQGWRASAGRQSQQPQGSDNQGPKPNAAVAPSA